MSPVFRHGNLRLYLLKLLDEAPRHGYEVIRLLQDRFLGVYAPSPGTIYPRLARLEEEGLVTHDEVDGRKVYRITDEGRAELHARLDDLAALEEEITASVRDIAREVSEDVRETVRNLREELASAARDIHGKSRPQAPRPAGTGPAGTGAAGTAGTGKAGGHAGGQPAGSGPEGSGPAGGGPAGGGPAGGGPEGGEHAGRGHDRDTWQQASDQPGDDTGWAGRGARHTGRGWAEWSGWGDWSGWSDWSGKGAWHGPGGHRALRDLERVARQFARDLRAAAWHAQAVSEDALDDLRDILDQAMDRIRSEVFTSKTPSPDQPREREPEDSP
jgi:DNA-binding PadR family transcriptional regulator